MRFYELAIHFKRDTLGSQPSDPEIRRKFITAKMTTGRTGVAAEVAQRSVEKEIDNAEADAENIKVRIEEIAESSGLTLFHRDQDGRPAISDVQLRGFIKAAFAFEAQRNPWITKRSAKKDPDSKSGVRSDGTRVDCYGDDKYRRWIGERVAFINQYAPIPDDVEIIVDERPLRSSEGERSRVALTASERAKAPFTVKFELAVYDEVEEAWLRKALDRGMFHGISQWSNAQWGTFTYDLKLVRETGE